MESRNYFHQDGAAVTASSYSSRHNVLVAGLSTGMFGRRYSVGIRLEPSHGYLMGRQGSDGQIDDKRRRNDGGGPGL